VTLAASFNGQPTEDGHGNWVGHIAAKSPRREFDIDRPLGGHAIIVADNVCA
jgi:hypothetical protein